MKRKHRLIVDITLDKPGTEKDAIRALDYVLSTDAVWFNVKTVTKISKPISLPRLLGSIAYARRKFEANNE